LRKVVVSEMVAINVLLGMQQLWVGRRVENGQMH
jgi:hypothetical protein